MSMDQDKFECILPAITAQVVDLIIQRNGWDENKALSMFMKSVVYDRLQNEAMKVWHFSPHLIAELFEDELNGELEWPEIG